MHRTYITTEGTVIYENVTRIEVIASHPSSRMFHLVVRFNSSVITTYKFTKSINYQKRIEVMKAVKVIVRKNRIIAFGLFNDVIMDILSK